MSNHRRNRKPHCPPPPYAQYPPGPPPNAPGAFAYIPVQVPVMPMPQPQPQPKPSQPTVIINNIHHPPTVPVAPPPIPKPTPVQIQDPISWVPTTSKTVHTIPNVVEAGKEGWDGSPLYVIRAHHQGELVPGKIAIKHGCAYIPYNGKEIPIHDFEILCAPPQSVRWVPASQGRVPGRAISAGKSRKGEDLYIARAAHRGSLTPGKVHPSHGCAYISFGGNEVSIKDYEVLCAAMSPSVLR